ncbi:di-heme oxidoredictase family protein [Cystobacter fuscus]
MRRALIPLLCLLASGCGDDDAPTPEEALPGGETTVHDTTRNAFTLVARNLQGERRDAFFVGNALFNRNWVTAPASTEGLDGLGPTFNASSCAACHFKDGRGKPPTEPGEKPLSLLFRLSIPGVDEHGGPWRIPSMAGSSSRSPSSASPPRGRWRSRTAPARASTRTARRGRWRSPTTRWRTWPSARPTPS